MPYEDALYISAYPAFNRIPAAVLEVLYTLESAGFESWLVGGWVRDALRNANPSDFDMATAAPWQDVQRICIGRGFAVHETGTAHGTVTVVARGIPIEVTTFRTEGSYGDHRHPDGVQFVQSIEEDLARRDFTVNAMAFHPTRGILDPYDGQNDVANGIIRCVGNPRTRFGEDALRVLRALRFASQFGYQLDPATEAAVRRCAPDLVHVAGERILREFEQLICGEHVRWVLMRFSAEIGVVLPELMPMCGFDQRSRWHIYDVWEHTAHVVENMPPTPLGRWAALFHDAGKPDTFFIGTDGAGHMPGHPIKSVDHLRAAAKRLHCGRRFLHDLELLVRHHDDHLKGTRKTVISLFNSLEGDERLFHVMCDLQRADALGQAPFSHARVGTITASEELFDEMLAAGECLRVSDLAITGEDLMALGMEEGPSIGLVLGELFNAVVDEKVPNKRDELLAHARSFVR